MPSMTKPSPKMLWVGQHANPQLDTWDLCADHGLLGLYAYRPEHGRPLYLVDISPKAVEQAKLNLQKYLKHSPQSGGHIYLLCQDAQKIELPENCQAIVMGVGGHLILKIMGAQKNQKKIRWLLGPERDTNLVGDYLRELGMDVFTQELVLDPKMPGRKRTFFVAQAGEQ